MVGVFLKICMEFFYQVKKSITLKEVKKLTNTRLKIEPFLRRFFRTCKIMNIEEIPSEVLGDIFSYLSLKESYLVARVCKKFHFALGETKVFSNKY